MKKIISVFIVSMTALSISCNAIQEKTPLDDYNIVWNSQSENAAGSMPLVGGDIGCNVWVENNQIFLYVQRSGSLSENGEYLKMGRFRLDLTPNPFKDSSAFRQELKLRDGYIEIEAKKSADKKEYFAVFRLWVQVDQPIVHVDVRANFKCKLSAAYESWRTENTELKHQKDGGRDRFTCFNLEGYPGKVIRVKDEIEFDNNGVLFYHRNPEKKLVPEVLIKQQNLEEYASEISDDIKNRTFGGFMFGDNFVQTGTGTGHYLITPFKSWSVTSKKAKEKHSLKIVSHIEQADTLAQWKKNLMQTVSKSSDKSSFKKTVDWWHQFWDRSHIFIYPDAKDPSNANWQMSRNYQLFRYQLGGNVNGEYPTRFNGGNLVYDPILMGSTFKYDPDWRQWGGAIHTAQNQRLLNWPMLKAGDFDLILPQFELYRKGHPGARARVKKHFDHEGAVFSEYMHVPGISFGCGWGWDVRGHRGRGTEIPFGDERATGNRGYNSLVEAGVMANQSCAYHWESQLEHAYMVLEYHRFSGKDISQYMPFIKDAVIFFDKHYQKRQKMRNGKTLDENGKLVIYPSTGCETYRGAKNPADLIAGLNACLKSLIALDEKHVSKEDKKYYGEYLKRIPDYTYGEKEGCKIIKPAESWMSVQNIELCEFYPLFPFNQFKLSDKEIQIFRDSYKYGPSFKNMVVSWHQDGIFLARMGMAKEAGVYNTRKLKNCPRRFPTFWGPGHDWVPDHNWGGSGMIGLQEMLLQTVGDKIVLFPAWPKEWDVDVKLHAPKNTTIEATLKDGKVTNLIVTPKARRKDVVVMID